MKKTKPITDKCCKCDEIAVAYWPAIDPDIPSDPYCRKHLDISKLRYLEEMWDLDNLRNSREEDN